MADENQTGKPVKEEIAKSGDGRDITKPYLGPLEENQDTVLAGRGSGLEIYEELLRDPQVFSCFQQRRMAVISREWQVDPGATDKQSGMAADFFKEMLFAPTLEFDDKCNKMLYAQFYGYGTSEMMWGQDGRHVVIDQIKVRRARRFRFDRDGGLRLLTRADMMTGELMPPKKFWTWAVGGDNDDMPYGLGLGHHCYWPVYFKRNGLKFWLMFLEKFGQPTVVAKHPSGADKAMVAKVLSAAQAVSTDTAVALPEGFVLELLEAARSGNADYEALHDKMDGAIAKVILSQTMTTDNGSSKSQGEVHFDVRKEVTKSDADLQCASFMRGPARWLTEWNFPGAVTPRIFRVFDEPEDIDARATRDKSIYDMGFDPSVAYVNETYGGEWTKREAPPNPFPLAPGQTQFAEGPARDGQDKIIDTLAADWKPVMEPIRSALQKTIDDCKSFDEVRAALAAFDDADVAAMVKPLADKIASTNFEIVAGGILGDVPEGEKQSAGFGEAVRDAVTWLWAAMRNPFVKGLPEFAELTMRDFTPQRALQAFRKRLERPTPEYSWNDLFNEEHSKAFTVAKTAGHDVIGDIASSLEQAIANGETKEAWAKKITPILQEKGWWGTGPAEDPITGEVIDAQLGSPRRLKTIYDVNVRQSYSAGRWLDIERNKEDLPYLMYVAVHDGRTRPEHRAWDGTCLPIDDPWWSTHYPPNGWNCRCTVVAVTKRQHSQLSQSGRITTDAPPVIMRQYTNPRTGEVTALPNGIDAGFAYNAGKALVEALTGG